MSDTFDKHIELVNLASSLVGTVEQGGDNKGSMVEEFQKAVDGKATREPWCLAMIQYGVKKVDLLYDEMYNRSHIDRNVLYQTEHVQTLWNKTSKEQQVEVPFPGCIVCWAFNNSEGERTTSGHAGIVVKVTDTHIYTVEGNTGPDDKTIVREGDGVYKKLRKRSDYTRMKVLGYLNPWE